MRKQIHLVWALIIVLVLSGVILLYPRIISYAASTVIIQVSPSISFAKPGEKFTVKVNILYATDVYAWQVNMSWNPSVLNISSSTFGDFLESAAGPEGTTQHIKIRYETGSVLLGESLIGDYAGASGSGTLATLNFTVLAQGETLLNIDDVLTLLLDSWGYDIEFTPKNGFFFNLDYPPRPSFTYTPSVPDVGETITFNASASYDPDGNITRYEWDFGDGTKVSEMGPITNHTYMVAKTYTVTLTVIDDANATNMIREAFNTTEMPHIWYELYSSYSIEIEFAADHDVAVIYATALPSKVEAGQPVTINVTVENQGRNPETFDVKAYYDSKVAATTTVENLGVGENKTLMLTWDTTDVAPGLYVIKAEAVLEGDEDLNDNVYEDGTVDVELSGTSFPLELVIIGVVFVIVVGIGVLFYVKRRRSAT